MKTKNHLYCALLLLICLGYSSFAQTILVPAGSTWKYLVTPSEPLGDWKSLEFADDSWASGAAQIGYGDGDEITVIGYGGNAGSKYITTYYRHTFNVTNPENFQSLSLMHLVDDGAVLYINGTEVARVRMPGGEIDWGSTATGASDYDWETMALTGNPLVEGENVIAVEVHQANGTSSDTSLDISLSGVIDTTAPSLVNISPSPGLTVLELPFINVIFNESVTGVEASDFLINGVAAASIVTNNPNDYAFHFPTPPTGRVDVAFIANHGIKDYSNNQNPFAGGDWSYTLDPNAGSIADVMISEFLTGNDKGIRDDDGNRSDWIELYNRGPVEVNLNGWYLTDSSTNLTKWRLPEVVIGPNAYMIVWATGLDRTNASSPLHTSFRLTKEPGYLALVTPLPQTNVISHYDYPAQNDDISYGTDRIDQLLQGFFPTPTPGAANSASGTGFAGAPVFSVETGVFTNSTLSLTITSPEGTTVRYTLNGTVPTATSPLYSGPITFGTNVTVKARAFSSTAGILPSSVVAHTYLFLDSTTQDFSSNLPILIFDSRRQSIPGNVPPGGNRAKGAVTIFEPNVNGRSVLRGTPQFQGSAEFEVFGQTSAGFPQRPIRFEIHDEYGNDLDVPVLGFPADSDWRVRSTWNDKSLMNDYLAFSMFEEMGNYSVRRELVEVFVDSGGGRLNYAADYAGVMCLAETIKVNNDRVDIARLDPNTTDPQKITGGFIFKKDKDSTGDLNFSTTGGAGLAAQTLKVHEPKPNELRVAPVTGGLTTAGAAQVAALRGYINEMEAALYATDWLTRTGPDHYSNFLDVDSIVDQFWIVEFPKQIDGYRISSYYHKDRGGKVVHGPVWDWNLAFGNANYLQGGWTNGWYYELISEDQHVGWTRRLITGSASGTASNGDPDFVQKVADRWGTLRLGVMNGPAVVQRIEDLSQKLEEAALRHHAKWNRLGSYDWAQPEGTGDGRDVNYAAKTKYRGTTDDSVIGQVKKYMEGRFNWVDSQFAVKPVLSRSGGPVEAGAVITMNTPPGVTNYYTLDGTDPRLPGGGVSPSARIYSGPIQVNSNVRIVARARKPATWKGTWSPPEAASYYTGIPALRITEIMYNPAPAPVGSLFTDQDFEYIEVKNTGATSLNLAGFTIAGGINFTFTSGSLAAGESGVIVKNLEAFRSRYGDTPKVLGTFIESLNNAGDSLVLTGPLQEPILDFSYNDGWYQVTDGLGFPLVVADDMAPLSSWNLPESWRAGALFGGSPGAADPAAPERPRVLVNEVLVLPGTGGTAGIELHNSTDAPVNVSGWFLSDNFKNPLKYVIPVTPAIPARGFLVLEEQDFNNGTTGFPLSRFGGELWLFSGNGTDLTGYAHGVDFGASAEGASFGRLVTSTGDANFVRQITPSFGAENSGPLIGPIVISEIMYDPASESLENNVADEYIELHNISSNAVALFDGTNRVALRDAVSFTVAEDTSIGAGGYLLVVSFDPATNAAATAEWRTRFNVPTEVPIAGPFAGQLDNRGDSVELTIPGALVQGQVPRILADKVNYVGDVPWPLSAKGFGHALQRQPASAYGNDPASWTAGAPTPGRAFVPGVSPTILVHPQNSIGVAFTNFYLNVVAENATFYQWQHNSTNILGATSSTLVISNLQPWQAGSYRVVVLGESGAATSDSAEVQVRIPADITEQPLGRDIPSTLGVVNIATNFQISVTARSESDLHYQWRQNGELLPGETGPVLNITNIFVNPEYRHVFDVLVSDDVATVVSAPAVVNVLVRPVYLRTPQPIHAFVGDTVVLDVEVAGTPTEMGFRWRKRVGSTTQTIGFSTEPFYVIENVALSDASPSIDVITTNLAYLRPGVLSSPGVPLVVWEDNDGDRIPDSLEAQYGFNPNVAETGGDVDGDGLSDSAEFLAGTNPTNAASVLKLLPMNGNILQGGEVTMQFDAASNHSYSVQFNNTLDASAWQGLTNFVTSRTNRVQTFRDSNPDGYIRYYRIVVPHQR